MASRKEAAIQILTRLYSYKRMLKQLDELSEILQNCSGAICDAFLEWIPRQKAQLHALIKSAKQDWNQLAMQWEKAQQHQQQQKPQSFKDHQSLQKRNIHNKKSCQSSCLFVVLKMKKSRSVFVTSLFKTISPHQERVFLFFLDTADKSMKPQIQMLIC